MSPHGPAITSGLLLWNGRPIFHQMQPSTAVQFVADGHAQEIPHIFDGIQVGTPGRPWQHMNVVLHQEMGVYTSHMRTGVIMLENNTTSDSLRGK